ncbi:hypothetical protein [Wolbachia endosymbiont of Psylliodes chrysocephala]|nr:hypothetical protein [Wolbachia endosymbiont of Psylliodes chrysocephala]
MLAGPRDTANESRYDVGLLSFQCSFFCHPSSPLLVIPVRDTGI